MVVLIKFHTVKKGYILNLVADNLGLTTLVSGWLILLFSLVWAFRTALWYKLEDKASQHVLLGVALFVFLVWQLAATLNSGFSFHFLFMTLVTLMFGPQFAIVVMLIALLGVTIQLDLGWWVFGINAFLMGLLPVSITWFMYRIGARFLDANFFVYILYNGFLSAAVGIVVSLTFAAIVLSVNDVMSYEALKHNFIVYIPLMAMPEGFVNGMLLMAFILLKPHWLVTFFDDKYIKRK